MASIATNKEGEMPSWPIPEEWKDAAALNNAGVKLYGFAVSPPCCKIKTILKNYGVNYTYIDGKKPDSDYKKVPVLMIGDKQINDSAIIVRILTKVLTGAEMSEEELELEKMNTSGLMMAMEASVMDNAADLRKCGRVIGGCMGCVLIHISCFGPCCGISKNIRTKFPEMESIANYRTIYAKKLENKQFFHGESAGMIDWSIFGLISPFSTAQCGSFKEFVSEDAVINAWYARMQSLCNA